MNRHSDVNNGLFCRNGGRHLGLVGRRVRKLFLESTAIVVLSCVVDEGLCAPTVAVFNFEFF